MSMKKWIAISVLFLAGMSVLAHGVFPHFYHDNMVCLVIKHAGHCDMDGVEHDHAASHNHNHCEDCPLKNTVVRQSDGSTYNLIPVLTLAVHHACGLIGCHLEDPPIFTYSEQKPYLESYIVEYVVLTLGLRAPPRISFLG